MLLRWSQHSLPVDLLLNNEATQAGRLHNFISCLLYRGRLCCGPLLSNLSGFARRLYVALYRSLYVCEVTAGPCGLLGFSELTKFMNTAGPSMTQVDWVETHIRRAAGGDSVLPTFQA